MFRAANVACREVRSVYRRPSARVWLSTSCDATRPLIVRCRCVIQLRSCSLPRYCTAARVGHIVIFRRWYCPDLPPHTRVAMPSLSPTMEVGTIVTWDKKEGDKVTEGEVLCEIETDKATIGFETPEEGYLAKIVMPAGSKDIPLGKLICVLVSNDKDIAAFKNFKDDSTPAPSAPKPAAAATTPPATAAPTSSGTPGQLPPHQRVSLPALSPTMETGTIVSWNKKEGEKLSEGELLCQIETDKAAIGFETPEEGYLAKIVMPAGSKDVPLGKLIAITVSDPKDVAAFKDFKDDGAVAPAPAASTAQEPAAEKAPSPVPSAPTESAVAPPAPGTPRGRLFTSPLAKRLAAEKGISLAQVSGSGPGGRIIAKDLDSVAPVTQILAAPLPSGAGYQDIPLTKLGMERAMAAVKSKKTIPHYYLTMDITMDALLSLREELNKALKPDKIQLAISDFVIKAAALACLKYPAANSSFLETFIREYKSVDIGTTVVSPEGLVTPVILAAQRKGLSAINQDFQRLTQKAQDRKLQPQDVQGATITVSYLGMFGVKNAAAIIIPPQACILTAGCPEDTLVPDDASSTGYRTAKVMQVTLSCDHRVIDGAVGAQWLKVFKELLEKPHKMLL